MDGFWGGFILGLFVVIFVPLVIRTSINDERKKAYERRIRREREEYYKSQNSMPQTSKRDSEYVEGALWQNFYDSAKSLLYAYGITDDNTLSLFCRSVQTITSNEAIAEFISTYERKDPPTALVFKEAVRRNFELLTEELEKNRVPHSIEVRKHFEDILDRCTNPHTFAYFRINRQINFTGMIPFGVVSLNYYMYAYHFYLQAVMASPSFLASMSDSVHCVITKIGRENGVLNEDQMWTDALVWGELMCDILSLTITTDDLIDVNRIFDKLEGKL